MVIVEKYDQRYVEFIELFNERRYWDSHEVLEDLWLEQRDNPHRLYFKALIQLAGSLYHVERSNFTPAWSLYRSASKYLEEFPPECLGLKVKLLLDEMSIFIKFCENQGLRDGQKWPIIKTGF